MSQGVVHRWQRCGTHSVTSPHHCAAVPLGHRALRGRPSGTAAAWKVMTGTLLHPWRIRSRHTTHPQERRTETRAGAGTTLRCCACAR